MIGFSRTPSNGKTITVVDMIRQAAPEAAVLVHNIYRHDVKDNSNDCDDSYETKSETHVHKGGHSSSEGGRARVTVSLENRDTPSEFRINVLYYTYL